MKITEDMRVCDIVNLNDETERIFKSYGMECSGCPGAAQETLLEAAEGHGVSVDDLLRDLNAEAEKA